jgi:hypothetical protein
LPFFFNLTKLEKAAWFLNRVMVWLEEELGISIKDEVKVPFDSQVEWL